MPAVASGPSSGPNAPATSASGVGSGSTTCTFAGFGSAGFCVGWPFVPVPLRASASFCSACFCCTSCSISFIACVVCSTTPTRSAPSFVVMFSRYCGTICASSVICPPTR